MKFPLGQLVATASVAERMEKIPSFAVFVHNCLERHLNGDWGEMCEEDKWANDGALAEKEPGRLFSSYNINENEKIWIITEWDRSYTTILLPSEY